MMEIRTVRRAPLSVYNPYRTFEDMGRKFISDSLNFFTDSQGAFRVDLSDQGDNYLLEADLPGFEKENIHIDVENDLLTITAERHSPIEDETQKDKYIRCERPTGTFSRSFDMSSVDTEHIQAKYTDGVLKLALPKKPEILPQSRRVELE